MAINFPDAPALNDTFASGGQVWRWDGTKWAVGSSGPSGRGDGVNILRRNGGFEIWQRGAGGSASIVVPASSPNGVYTADGWYLATGANQLCVVAQGGSLWPGSQSSAYVGRQSGQTGVAPIPFCFPLDTDELYSMLGKFVRLSFVAMAGANFSPAGGALEAILIVGTGAPVKYVLATYTAQSTPIGGTVNLTTVAQRFQLNSTVVVPANTRQAEIMFRFTPTGTAGASDNYWVDDVQLEIVPAATGYVSSDFQRLNFEEQLLLCQRHFWKTINYSLAPVQAIAGLGSGELQWQAGVAAGITTIVNVRHPVPMRAVPSVIGILNPQVANGAIRNASQGLDCTGSNISYNATTGFQLFGTTPAGTTAASVMCANISADAGI